MDIQQAIDVLAGGMITRQKEIDAFNVASAILSDKFTAEFTSRDQALTEMSATYTKLDEEKAKTATALAHADALTSEKALVESALEDTTIDLRAKETEVDALQTAYDNALTEKNTLITESAVKDAQIETLTQEKTGVQGQLDGIVPPVVELLSSVTEEERANHPVLDVIQEQIDVIQPPEL